MNLKEITGGMRFDNVTCVIRDFEKDKEQYKLTLSDSSCTKNGYLKANLFDYEQVKAFRGKVVLVSGLHEPGLQGVVAESLKIKNIELKPDSEGDLVENLPHIDASRLGDYICMIDRYKSFVGKETRAYRLLLEAFFSEENLSLMKTMPATHIRQGSPLGGMLHATAAVTDMAYYLAMRYLNCANGVYSFRERRCINWDLLITGGLLHLAGNLLYFETEVPHHKRAEGIEQGFSICRQQVLLKLIYANGIDISEEELAALLGAMSRLNEQHNGIKKCRQEAVFLWSAYSSFLEMDSFDAVVAAMLRDDAEKNGENTTRDSYDYSERLGCYVSKDEIRRKAVILGLEPEYAQDGKGGLQC